MTADPILTLAWLVAAHLVADFLLQTGGIVAAKSAGGVRAMRGLLAHGAGVGVALIPVALAFGPAGLWALLFITASHLLIDRIKVLATRRAEARALAAAHRRHEGRAPAAGLGRAWTPLPAAYFVFDQLAHAAMLVLAWAIWLDGQGPTVEWTAAVDGLLAGRDQAAVHEISLALAVGLGLVIANARGGALLVGTLVRPLEAARELQSPEAPAPARISPGAHPAALSAAARTEATTAKGHGRAWSFRIGPLAGRVVAEPPPAESAQAGETAAEAVVAGERVALPPPVKVGATIGVIERLLIVVFVLVGADAAIGFVVGAKTIARFKQLDDRDFAEYYLLGTLASVSIAIATALVARAAFAA